MNDLRQSADLVLKMLRSNLQRSKAAGMVIVVEEADGTIHQLPQEFSDKLAALLNVGLGKDLLFGVIRYYIQSRKSKSVVFGTEAWRGKSTAAARDMPHDEFMRLAGESGFETLLAMGLVERSEAIVATAQDEHTVVVVSQPFRRLDSGEVYSYGEVEVQEFPQEGFQGRQKMYGNLAEENLR